MIHLQCKEGYFSLDHDEQLSKSAKAAFLSHLCHWWAPLKWWELLGWDWTKVDVRAEDIQATKTSAHFILPAELLNSCLPTSGVVSQTCQPAAALRGEITALLRAAAVTGLIQMLQIFGCRVQLLYPGQNEIWQVLPLSGRESTTPWRLEVLLLEVLYLDKFLVEEFNDFLSGRWMAALQVAQHHFLSTRFSEAW